MDLSSKPALYEPQAPFKAPLHSNFLESMLCYIIPHYVTLYYIVLYHILFYSTLSYYIRLYFIMLDFEMSDSTIFQLFGVYCKYHLAANPLGQPSTTRPALPRPSTKRRRCGRRGGLRPIVGGGVLFKESPGIDTAI